MANITGSASEKVFQIQKWLGLNENPDGDTKLKMGEAAAMRNFRVTRDGNLQKRPGTKAIQTVAAGAAIDDVWRGVIRGTEYVMAICGGSLYMCWDNVSDVWRATNVGSFAEGTDRPHMFGFADKLYILTGYEYYRYDPTATHGLEKVDGYVPLVATAVGPNGGGELLEQVNKLTKKRRAWYSPDGTSTVFRFPEKLVMNVTAVRSTAASVAIPDWTFDVVDGTVTFAAPPEQGTSTIEIEWEADADFRSEITAMHFSETYNGAQDTRVFLYGDGSNTTLYSDINHDGQASAEYFPDQNEVRVGAENTPITGLIRHYSALVAFKSDSTYGIQYGNVTLATGDVIPAFYVSPVNRAIGNEAPGQVQLVLNNPMTLYGQDVYEWRNSSYYSSNLTRDERQARRISDRVFSAIHSFDTRHCVCFDDNYHQEYYICDPSGIALVYGYATDAWYFYTDFPMKKPFTVRGELYYGADDGRIYHVSGAYYYDEHFDSGESKQEAIDCYWESGSMSFGADYQRKNSAMIWIGVKPEVHAFLEATVETDKEAVYATKEVDYNFLDFSNMDFSDFSFSTRARPVIRRLKIKVKKFVYYKLILKSSTNDTSCTATTADMRVRFMGYAK